MRLLVLTLTVLAAAPAAGQRRMRHEFVPRGFFERHRVEVQVRAALEDGQPVPDAVHRDGERLPAPGADADAPGFGNGGISRPSEARPDRDTEADGALKYHAVFNPSVAPLRRNVAFDAIDADYRLHVAKTRKVVVPLSPRKAVPGRELFWGDVRVDVARGRAAAIPSVAPDMRVLAVRSEPAGVAVEFLRDGGDNFYVRAPHDGELRVVFLADADTAYFSAPVPGNVPLGAQAGSAHTELPAAVGDRGRRVLERLGVRADMPFDRGLDRLVAWFRDFAAGEAPGGAGDIYEDLALGQKGVCRHRSFGFLVTARAAGVPTRYVQNEAHAFVEVRAPDGRWRRIDLGGEAPSLDISGGEKRKLHTPPADPFAKPDRYLAQYSAMLGGQGGAAGPGGPEVNGAPPALGAGGAGPGDPSGSGAGGGGGGPASDPDAPLSATVAEVPLPLHPDDAPADGPPTAQDNFAAPVAVQLESPVGRQQAFRGEEAAFKVSGVVTGGPENRPVGGLKVQVYLLAEDDAAVPVADLVVTDGAGRFAAKVKLPRELTLGRYRLVVATKGTDRWSAGRSDPAP